MREECDEYDVQCQMMHSFPDGPSQRYILIEKVFRSLYDV
jgi:hypothetical protein